MNVFSLLYISGSAEHQINTSASGIDVYVDCAHSFGSMLQRCDYRLTIITNDIDALQIRRSDAKAFTLRHQAFELDVPVGIAFRSAHYKLEVLKAFGSGTFGSNPILSDVDMAVVRRPEFQLPKSDEFIAYDITDHMVAEVGEARIRSDLSALAKARVSSPSWFGGEWICAGRQAYCALAEEIYRIWPRYVERIDHLCHVGDEIIVSAALNKLKQDGWSIRDAGREGIVRRWWSARTSFPQSPLAQFSTADIWHLPSDKIYLASIRNQDFEGRGKIYESYRKYVSRRLLARRLVNGALNTIRRERKFAAHL